MVFSIVCAYGRVQTSNRCWWDRLFLGLSSNMSTWLTPACLQPYVLMPERRKTSLSFLKMTRNDGFKEAAIPTLCAREEIDVGLCGKTPSYTQQPITSAVHFYTSILCFPSSSTMIDTSGSGRREGHLEKSLV